MDGEAVNPIEASDKILPRCGCGNRRFSFAPVAYTIERRARRERHDV